MLPFRCLFHADFPDQPKDELWHVGEKVFKRLYIADIGPFIPVVLYAGTARIIEKSAFNIIPRVFPAPFWPVRVD